MACLDLESLGFKGLDLPIAPDCGDGTIATYGVNFSIKGLKFVGDYRYRGERYLYDDRGYMDEHVRYGFKVSNREINYSCVINNQVRKWLKLLSRIALVCTMIHTLLNIREDRLKIIRLTLICARISL